MSYHDIRKLFATIIEAVSQVGDIKPRMHAVIAECAAQKPHADWQTFRDLDYGVDTERLKHWLSDAYRDEAATLFKGLWVGLVQLNCDGKRVADAYLAAAPEFEAGAIDWTDGLKWAGEDSYLNSKILESIYRLAYDGRGGLGNDAEYPLVLAYGAMAAIEALQQPALPFALRSLRGAAVGYDGGDFLFLGEFRDGRFVRDVKAG
jgi:hypothetical protein